MKCLETRRAANGGPDDQDETTIDPHPTMQQTPATAR